MSREYKGVITRIAYPARKRTNDHVDVRLTEASGRYAAGDIVHAYRCGVASGRYAAGDIVHAYRCGVEETGPQECAEPTDEIRNDPREEGIDL